MTRLLSNLGQRIIASFETTGRERARKELLQLDPRLLKDVGLSQALLLQGTSAWPWKLKQEQNVVVAVPRTREQQRTQKREERQAIRELKAMTDAELSDLAISRGDIERAVRTGVRDINIPATRQAA